MAQLGKRRFINALKHSPASYVVLVLLATLFVYSAVGAYKKSRLADNRMSASVGELAKLEEQKARLTTELENSKTDFGREKALREKFNVVKEGEQVIMIVDKQEEITPAESPKTGFWAKIFGK